MASSSSSEGEEEEQVGEDERYYSRRFMCEIEEFPSERWLKALSFSSCDLDPSASTDGAPDPAGRIPSRGISGLPSPPPSSGGRKGGAPASQGRENKKKASGRPPIFKRWGREKKPPLMEPVVKDEMEPVVEVLEDEMEPVVEDDFTEIHMGNLTRYSNDEIQMGREKLRRDSCYHVYKGRRRTGEYVTVKRYCEPDGRLDHLKAELRAASVCRHPNVMECLGWFRRNGNVRLVYEFLTDTLASRLESNDVLLTWEARHKISLDLASAILCIHEDCGQCVYHGDIKPGHVLLDSKLNAKLADFEFAHFKDHAEDEKETVRGTIGYLDPEYINSGVYTKASGVYSFGIVLLQLATGIHPYRIGREIIIQGEPSTNPSGDEESTPYKSLFDWVLERHLGNKLLDVVDKRLGSEFDRFEKERVLQTGLLCTQPDSHARPSIYEAIAYLGSGVPISALLDIKSEHNEYLPDKLPGKKVSHQELRNATNYFGYDSIVWIGGNGVIYQGDVDNVNIQISSPESKMHVAIKKMCGGQVFGRTELFVGEIQTLGSLKHKNIVQLIGWCFEYGKCLILYEFMANGNLFSYLYPASKFLPWETRYKIALDLSCAILYIHEEHEVNCILHTNITSTNILLDENYTCKLTGFETAMELGQDIDRAMHRTPCYMDPEAVESGKFSKASDIYSFGLIVLEIACGKTTIYVDEHGEKFYLYDEVLDLYNKGTLLKAADERLNMQFDAQEMEGLLLLGLSCAHRNSRYRPSIRHVVQEFKLRIPQEKEPCTIYSDTSKLSIMNENVPEPVTSIASTRSFTTSASDDMGVHADTTVAQESFDIGIPHHYSYNIGPYKEFHLQVMKGCMSGLHEKIKSGACFSEVVDTMRKLTLAMMSLQAPLIEWDSLAQDVLRTLKQIETLKAKYKKEDMCLSSSNLSILREEMEQHIENDKKDGEQAAAIQEEYNLLLNTKCDLEKQLVEVQDKIKDAETRLCSLEEKKEAIEKRRKQCEEVLEGKREECFILVLYDTMLSRVVSFSSV